jgi:hypothetical protein
VTPLFQLAAQARNCLLGPGDKGQSSPLGPVACGRLAEGIGFIEAERTARLKEGSGLNIRGKVTGAAKKQRAVRKADTEDIRIGPAAGSRFYRLYR